jgi:uncharacterized membrane protein
MYSSHLHYFPATAPFFVLGAAVLAGLFILVQLGLLRYAYMRLGLDSRVAMLVLFCSLLGSYVNVPLAHLAGEQVAPGFETDMFGIPYAFPDDVDWSGTIVAANVGGAIIPMLLSIYLLARNQIWGVGVITAAIVAIVVNHFSQIVPGLGIAVPIVAPPLVTVVTALLLSRRFAAPLAYAGGSLGTLIGADLMNLPSLPGIGTPIVSIGGAGTFDGIFLTGIVAVLLASLLPVPAQPTPAGVRQ